MDESAIKRERAREKFVMNETMSLWYRRWSNAFSRREGGVRRWEAEMVIPRSQRRVLNNMDAKWRIDHVYTRNTDQPHVYPRFWHTAPYSPQLSTKSRGKTLRPTLRNHRTEGWWQITQNVINNWFLSDTTYKVQRIKLENYILFKSNKTSPKFWTELCKFLKYFWYRLIESLYQFKS